MPDQKSKLKLLSPTSSAQDDGVRAFDPLKMIEALRTFKDPAQPAARVSSLSTLTQGGPARAAITVTRASDGDAEEPPSNVEVFPFGKKPQPK